MAERLVDVKKSRVKHLHTFPISISDPPAEAADEAFKRKALEAAANAHLVPNSQLGELEAVMHVDRGGPITQCGDTCGIMTETKPGLDQVVRERAYLLWEQAGRATQSSEKFWHQAQQERFRERAYALWEREGCPDGRSEEHWHRTREFEES
jgi:hypothetical protein